MEHKRGFWAQLKKPIIALAPLADVTDAAFRRIIARIAKPDVMYTEFVSADGLVSAGRDKLFPDLWYDESERPIVAQLFSANPDKLFAAAKLVQKLGFDGLDINMGCPDRSVEKQGAGAALIKNPKLAVELIAAAKAGADKLPISVKTRIGYGTISTEQWVETLLGTGLACLTLHLRTRREMSKVPAHWDEAMKAVAVRNRLGVKTIILGNGDVATPAEARAKSREAGVDGVLIGRGIFGNPWLWSAASRESRSARERLGVLVTHTQLFETLFTGHKRFAVMKKHFASYTAGLENIKALRDELMAAETSADVQNAVTAYLKTASGS